MSGTEFALEYKFSCEELKALAAFFRERENQIPIALYGFSRAAQNKVYECMSIDDYEEGCNNESEE